MRPLFSEFSFGFAVASEIRELIVGRNLAAPVFPSLLDERELGWDVKFSLQAASLFLQFKRSDYLSRASAREWRYFGSPYFRFPLYKPDESPQHNRLVRLAKKEPHVYYSAPLFYTDSEFNQNYLARTVLDASVMVRVGGLPPIRDEEQHVIAYDNTPKGYFLSDPYPEPYPIEQIGMAKRRLDGLVTGMAEGRAEFPTPFNLRYLQTLWSTMSQIMAEEELPAGFHIDRAVERGTPSELARVIRLLARSVFGVEWLVLSRRA